MIKLVRYLILISILGILLSCGNNNAGEKKVMGPEETAEAFCRAMVSGNFAEAMELCDTVAMKGYLREQTDLRGRYAEQDSCATCIASAMLEEKAEINIDKVIKEGDSRHVYCSIGFNGNKKKKQIILQKEGEIWKVIANADKN